MKESYLHVLVSSASWGQEEIKYRRHRLIEYIKGQNDTIDILWVYPANANLRRPNSYLEANRLMRKNPVVNNYNIKEWALPDIMPHWLMQFKSSFGHPQFIKLIDYINRYDGKKIIWFSYPVFPYLTKMLKWDKVVYDCSDLWVAQLVKTKAPSCSTRFANKLIDQSEKLVINKSDKVFASSQYLAERINMISERQAILVENGVDPLFFLDCKQSGIDLLKHVPRPRLGYVGPVRLKLDLSLLNDIAELKPEWSFVIVGPNCLNEDYSFRSLIKKKNIYWAGAADYKKIPGYISSLDVGLLPYREIDYNKAVFPIKYYEYLSQGIPVVGCGLPSTKIHIKKGIYLHVRREHFLKACNEALVWSENDQYYQDRIKIAGGAIWDQRFKYMLDQVKYG